MRRLIPALAALLLAACAAAPVAPANPADVIAAAEAWGAAFNSRDPVQINGMYAPDTTFWGTTAKSIATTPSGVAEYFKDVSARPNTRVKFDSHNVRFVGDTATDAGNYTFFDAAAGTTNPARFSMVFARRDGKWVLVHHHSSRVPN